MRLDELDYTLPPELIAQVPLEPRDASRLLVASGAGASLAFDDRAFRDLPGLLRPGDVLVRNDTRVIPARAHFRRATGGRVELLFLEPLDGADAGATPSDSGPAAAPATASTTPGEGRPRESWEVLARGRLRPGETLRSEAAPAELAVEVGQRLGDGRWTVRTAGRGGESLGELLGRHGETPLPPYIRAALADPERYQTVYARLRGSAAAPTAGLHFTRELDGALRAAGIAIEHLTLHVGLATFKPVTAARLEDHPLHEEPYVVERTALARIAAARAAGGRVVAVGTTMVRLLEELGAAGLLGPVGAGAAPGGDEASGGRDGAPHGNEVPASGGRDGAPRDEPLLEGRTCLFITPGHRFTAVDGLITNFHLPRTSLLALVMAFCGVEETRRLYEHAVARRYRFYSFGDAMLAWAGEGSR